MVPKCEKVIALARANDWRLINRGQPETNSKDTENQALANLHISSRLYLLGQRASSFGHA